MTKFRSALLVFSLVSMATVAIAATSPTELIKQYASQAKKANKSFSGFSEERGKSFYLAERTNKKGEKVSCATCHTENPSKTGKTKAGKAIEPMAVSVNRKRFTDKAKVEKWFKRNCDDVYARECTAQEKGDFITFLKSH